jgi:hypothetical protein
MVPSDAFAHPYTSAWAETRPLGEVGTSIRGAAQAQPVPPPYVVITEPQCAMQATTRTYSGLLRKQSSGLNRRDVHAAV